MKIEKVLNNNVAVTHDEQGHEIVVMGRGLAFGCRPGDGIDPDKVEKIFTIADASIAAKFHQLMTSIPMSHMLLSERIINYARIELGKKLSDSIYVTLPDHISSAIYRYEEGIHLTNPLLWDIRRFYKDEFAIGLKANQVVLEETGTRFLEDEAAFIAMHFVNAQLGEKMDKMYGITYIMQEICAIVRMHFDCEFDEDSLTYYRFITHLKFFAHRLLNNEHYDDDAGELLDVIRFKNADAYACAEKIRTFIGEKYDYTILDEEMLYITVHIARLSKETSQRKEEEHEGT